MSRSLDYLAAVYLSEETHSLGLGRMAQGMETRWEKLM